MVKKLPLTRGLFALVDDDVYEWASKFKWCASPGRKTYYAIRREWPSKKAVWLHRVIVGATGRDQVDHVDRNGLNDQRANLRVCTHGENLRNQPKSWGSKSRFKGVWKSTGGPSWYADLQADKRRSRAGPFATDEQAARAYDDLARQHHGAYARVNFPRAGERSAHG